MIPVPFAGAQTELHDATERYFQKVWQMEEGLPNNIVTAILQTRDGFLWIGTQNGLVRFDGVQFERFAPEGASGPGANRILQLLEDRSGTLWIGTEGGGLVWMKNGKMGAFTKENGLSHNRVNALAEDANGAIWAGTFGASIHRIKHGQIERFQKDSALLGRKMTGIAGDEQGNIWFNSAPALARFDGGRFLLNRQHRDGAAQILASKSGGIWHVNHNGIERFGAEGTLYKSGTLPWQVNRGEIRALSEDRNGALWIGTQGSGLFRFHDGRLDQVDTPHNNILALCEDDEGSLWAGTEGGGLIRVRQRAFVTYDATHGLPKDVVLSICESRDNGLLVVPQAAGVWKFQGETFSRLAEDQMPADQVITCVAAGPDGSIWLGTDGSGFYRFKDNQLAEFGTTRGFSGKDVRALLVDSRGDLWIGTFRHGLRRISSTGKLSSFTEEKGLSGNGIRALAEDRSGAIWVGNIKGGVDRIMGDSIRTFTTADGLPGHSIWTLYATDDGAVWAGTAGGGLLRFKDERLSRITAADGVQSDGISQILADDAGNLWFGGKQGIFYVEKSALDEFADGKRKEIKSVAYGKNDGLASIQCTHGYQPAACKTRDGQLWFSTSKGALRLNQAAREILRPPSRVYLSSLQVNGEKVPLDTTLEIAPGNHHLEFRFTSPGFVAPERIAFRYRLEGFDRDWVHPTSARSAEYSGLPPGDYRFQVSARDGSDVWTDGQSMHFSIQPAYWETIWFRALALTVFTLAIVVVVRFFVRRRYQRELRLVEQQHALERERARIAKDMHDDVGASLTQIAFLSDLAQKELDSPKLAQPHLRRIGQRSREVVQALDEIVWAVNPRNDTLTSLVEYLGHFIDDYLKATGIRCFQELPDSLPQFALSSEFRHNSFLIIKEALNNAVKHAGAATIWFRITVSNSVLNITLEDNGCGISPGTEDHLGEGLKNMRNRAEQLGGTFSRESVPGRGTKIVLSLPLAGVGNVLVAAETSQPFRELW